MKKEKEKEKEKGKVKQKEKKEEMKEKEIKKISPRGMKDMKRCGKTSGKM